MPLIFFWVFESTSSVRIFSPICLNYWPSTASEIAVNNHTEKEKVSSLLGEGEWIGRDDETYFPLPLADICI